MRVHILRVSSGDDGASDDTSLQHSECGPDMTLHTPRPPCSPFSILDLGPVCFAGTQKLAYQSGHRNNVFQARALPSTHEGTVVSCAADGQVCATSHHSPIETHQRVRIATATIIIMWDWPHLYCDGSVTFESKPANLKVRIHCVRLRRHGGQCRSE